MSDREDAMNVYVPYHSSFQEDSVGVACTKRNSMILPREEAMNVRAETKCSQRHVEYSTGAAPLNVGSNAF